MSFPDLLDFFKSFLKSKYHLIQVTVCQVIESPPVARPCTTIVIKVVKTLKMLQ